MSKWLKIRDTIHRNKIREVNGLFEEVKNKVHNTQVPRYDWITPLETWANRQIKSENTSLRLSLQEFTHLKQRIDDLYNDFAQNLGCEDEVLEETQNIFLQDYINILKSKENDLKLEISAELIEEKQFPLEVFVDWYKAAHTLSPEKFNEELGSFWGDVWKNAAGGAGIGGLAGMPGGLGGSFAGAGIGGLAGGLYGGASNLLKRVWQYRQTQRNFEQTKDKAVDALKKLKDLSQHFDMHPNFISSLDSMINQLGSARAYRWAQSGQAAPENTPAGKPVNPMKQPHPGWAELGKHSASSGPTASSSAPPVTPSAPTPTASAPTPTASAPTPTPAAPSAPPVDPEVEKKKALTSKWRSLTTRKRWHPNTMTPEMEAELEQLSKLLGKDDAAKPAAKPEDEEAERQAHVADAIGKEPPQGPPEETPIGIKDEQDFLNLYNKVKDDENTVAKLGMTLWNNGLIRKKNNEPLLRPGESLNPAAFNSWLNAHIDKDLSPEDFEFGSKIAKFYANVLSGATPTAEKPATPDESLGKPGTPKETPTEPGNEPVKPDLKTDEELMKMSRKAFEQYMTDLGYANLVDDVGMKDGHKRAQAIEALKLNLKHGLDKTESAFTRIGKMFQPRLNLSAIPMNERVNYLKGLLSSRGS